MRPTTATPIPTTARLLPRLCLCHCPCLQPYPQAIFELDFFRKNPAPFFLLAKVRLLQWLQQRQAVKQTKQWPCRRALLLPPLNQQHYLPSPPHTPNRVQQELFPGNYQPTPAHYFIRLLHDKGLLVRCFTQNIDSLERQAGLPPDAVVAAHGNFDSARCIGCQRPHDVEHVRRAVLEGRACRCTAQVRLAGGGRGGCGGRGGLCGEDAVPGAATLSHLRRCRAPPFCRCRAHGALPPRPDHCTTLHCIACLPPRRSGAAAWSSLTSCSSGRACRPASGSSCPQTLTLPTF